MDVSEDAMCCLIVFQEVTKISCVIINDPNPTWDEDRTFVFPIDPEKPMDIRVEIYDADGSVDTVVLDANDIPSEFTTVTQGRITARYARVYVYTEEELEYINKNYVFIVFARLTRQ